LGAGGGDALVVCVCIGARSPSLCAAELGAGWGFARAADVPAALPAPELGRCPCVAVACRRVFAEPALGCGALDGAAGLVTTLAAGEDVDFVLEGLLLA
jgi:hypothetical protein